MNDTLKPFSRPASAVRRMLSTAGIALACITIAVAGSGGSYALWNGVADVNAGTVRSGSTAITVNGMQNFTMDWDAATIGPGQPVYTTLAIANIGTTPVSTSVTTTSTAQIKGLADNLAVRVTPLTAGSVCDASLTTSPPAALVGFMAQAPQIQPGASVNLCLELSLVDSAPATVQGGSATFTITIDAVQVPRS